MASEVILECDAVLFDMDGTLVDSKEIVERMWLGWAREHGLRPEAVLAEAHGRRTLDTMQILAPHLATPEEAARLDALEAEEEGREKATPGAADLLAKMPAGRWAVVTSAARQIAIARIGGVGLPVPRVLVGSEDVARGKPSPDGYKLAAARLGFSASRCVVIEDTPAGVQAGRAAGSSVIGLRTTFPSLDDCDAVVQDLRGVRAEVSSSSAAIRLIVTSG